MTALKRLENSEIAAALDRVGDLLQAQHANPFRVRAYHRGAEILRNLDRSVEEILDAKNGGTLQAIPGIGASLASAVEELSVSGRLGLLERLEGQVSPEDVFTTVPGIGEKLAARIHTALHIDTLEELELAATDGRLEKVEGFGPRRVRAVRELLSTILGQSARRRRRQSRLGQLPREGAGGFTDSGDNSPEPRARTHSGTEITSQPSVALILAVDAEYRRQAKEGGLQRIRPKRFNPEGKAWLPVLHTEQGGWWFTALFSNTRRAHKLNRTHDWVVLFYEENGHEDQCTVVTEYQGGLAGKRVVRGRELECYDHYYPRRQIGPGTSVGAG